MQVARLNDRTQGTCSAHETPLSTGGKITSASPDVFSNGIQVARLGDTVTADCGHTSVIITASPDVFANDKQVARLNDSVGNGPYSATIISASPDVFAD